MTGADGMLSGLRVIDLATERAEMAGRVFADLGAEVIKVEPAGGCRARFMPPFAGDGSEPASLYWASVGLGKRSVVLDIDAPRDVATLRRLIATADVLIESFDPGYLSARGLGYDQLKAEHRSLVYVSVTPYGQSGPRANEPAGELVIEAAAGRVTCQGDGDREPVPLGYPQTAFHAGVQAAADAVLALHERSNSGRGQHLDVSAQAVMVWTLLHATGYPALEPGTDAPGAGANRPIPAAGPLRSTVARALFEAADGWCTATLGLGELGAQTFQYLMDWAASESALDPEFHSPEWAGYRTGLVNGTLDFVHLEAACDQMWAFLKSKTKRELMDRAVRDQLFIAPVYSVADLLDDPQLAANNFWVDVEGRTHPGPFARLDRLPMRPARPAPAPGADQALLDDLVPRPPRVETRLPAQPRRPALEGIKVADFSWLGVGPITAKALADHGATVVRVESELRPEMLRALGPFAKGTPGLNRSQFYGNFNTSKLGMALNLARPEGRELALRLVDWADVVVESFRPGAMARLGLDYPALAKTRPGLIMYSTCIRGQEGPERTFPGTGAQGAALCGMASITGWPDRPPAAVHGAYTDVIVPRYGTALIVSALLERQRSGLGQHIDMAQVEPGIRFLEPLVLDYTVNGRVAGQSGQSSFYSCPRGVYRVRGGERFVALEVETAAQWRALRSLAPLDAFAGPAFDQLDHRAAHGADIDAALREWCRDHDGESLAARLAAAGVPAAVALYPSQLFADAQLRHRGFFVSLEHDEMGLVPYDGLATIFSETPGRLRKAAPCLGADTHTVLSGLLGLPEDEITRYAEMDILR